MAIQEFYSLESLNTFGLPVTARYFTAISSGEELVEFIQKEWSRYPQKMILGGGSNVLFTSNYDGLVVQPLVKGIEITSQTEKSVYVKAMCGEVWDDFVKYCVEQNWGGLENLSLIPGHVGACPMQNIGAYGAEVKDTIHLVEAINLETGEIKTFENKACEFGYRTSIFKTKGKGKYLILSVTFQLAPGAMPKTGYADVTRELENYPQVTIQAVREAIIAIRKRKLPDPVEYGNAGSFFKNPVIEESKYAGLVKIYAKVPSYPVSQGLVKVPAAWFIEQAGLKGLKKGDTGTFQTQPLVIVNYGKATGKEIVDFAAFVVDTVEEKFGVRLEMEVNIIR